MLDGDHRDRWPEPPSPDEPEAATVRASYETRRLSEESLALLEALYRLHSGATDWARWARPLLARLEDELLAGPSADVPPKPQAEPYRITEAETFADVLKALWLHADKATKEALRTVAEVLGVSVPERMRRTKKPADKRPEGPAQGDPMPDTSPCTGKTEMPMSGALRGLSELSREQEQVPDQEPDEQEHRLAVGLETDGRWQPWLPRLG